MKLLIFISIVGSLLGQNPSNYDRLQTLFV